MNRVYWYWNKYRIGFVHGRTHASCLCIHRVLETHTHIYIYNVFTIIIYLILSRIENYIVMYKSERMVSSNLDVSSLIGNWHLFANMALGKSPFLDEYEINM